ncbi:MAG: dihydroorotate dehydrogenase [Rubripirellula sp.]
MHTDVTTSYLGMRLRSPLIVGACPLTLRPENVREFTIAGAGAVVLPSLLEEQVVRQMLERGERPSPAEERIEASSLATTDNSYNGGIDTYLQTIALLKQHTGIPIIANLNGCTVGSWLEFARQVELHGADAIELSLHTDTTDPSLGADAVERRLLDAVEAVCDVVSIPVSVKLLLFFTSLPNLGWRVAEAGASGLVLFGREPIWDLRDGQMSPTSHWSLSDSPQLQTTISGLVRLHSGGPRISVAASGGITTSQSVLHSVIAGADVAMVTSELYRTGPDAIAHILEGISRHLLQEGFASFDEFARQSRQQRVASQSRPSQIEPMTRREHVYPDPRPEPAQQTGDRWGHTVHAPLDES